MAKQDLKGVLAIAAPWLEMQRHLEGEKCVSISTVDIMLQIGVDEIVKFSRGPVSSSKVTFVSCRHTL